MRSHCYVRKTNERTLRASMAPEEQISPVTSGADMAAKALPSLERDNLKHRRVAKTDCRCGAKLSWQPCRATPFQRASQIAESQGFHS
jgi:hypothetical protein